jgi:hypothetical protein
MKLPELQLDDFGLGPFTRKCEAIARANSKHFRPTCKRDGCAQNSKATKYILDVLFGFASRS